MRSGKYFRNQLFLAMLIVALPLLALQASRLWMARSQAKADAYLSVQKESEKAARLIDASLARAEGLLTFLAGRSEITTLNPRRCTELLNGIASVDPLFVIVVLFDVHGRLVCSTSVVAGQPIKSVRDAPWFGPALSTQGFQLSKPFTGGLSNQKIVLLTLPVGAPAGSGGGLLGLSISIEALGAAMRIDHLPSNSSSALVDETDTIVARNPNPLGWVNRPVSDATKADRFVADGPVNAAGADGVERIFASTNLQHFGLRVVTGVPVEAVLGPIRRTAVQNASVVLGFALLAAFLAWLGSRRLLSPLQQLMTTARSNSAGDVAARAPLTLRGEFGELSTEFNRMLDARGSAEAHLREAERQARRLAAFYEALSKTNRAIASQLPPQGIFEAICRISVDTGCAKTAWIAVLDGTEKRVVASAGWTGMVEADGAMVLADYGLTVTAFKQGVAGFIGDTATDSRVTAWKASATLGKAGSAAAFPIRRGGSVFSVLTLYVEQTDAFDEKLVRLIEEMAADASFGLDIYDKNIALGRRDSQLAAIVETATDAIITVDHILKVKVFNGAAQRMFGVDAKAILGLKADALVPSRFREAATAGLEKYMAEGGAALLDGAPREYVGLRASGAEFPLQATFSRLGVDGGMLVTIVIRDITAVRESEQHLKAAESHEAANLAKTNFLSSMSHELRTPLTAVTGFAQLLLASTENRLDARERHQLAMILLAGRQLTALVDDVLDVSRIEVGHLGISLQDLELNHLVDSALQMCEESAVAHAVTLVRDYAGGPPLMLHSDPTRLRQVLLNVVTNAIKYNRRGGSVCVRIERGDDAICIKVSDTGMGLSKAQTDRLFEPFNRLGRERSEIPGTGIGLMLSRQLVELLGGSINLSSVEGVGTEVSIVLPVGLLALHQSLPGGSESVVADPRQDASHFPEPSGTVLYIEDNPVNVLIVEAVLEPWSDVKLVVAIDAAQGLARAFDAAPDLILLDIHLPDADGIDVLRSLRADPRTARLPIVALSASVMEWERAAALDAGATKYWSKPIDFDSFRAGVSMFLREASEHSAAENRLREPAV